MDVSTQKLDTDNTDPTTWIPFFHNSFPVQLLFTDPDFLRPAMSIPLSILDLIRVREGEGLCLSGGDGGGLFHDGLTGTVATVSADRFIKLWPDDEFAGDGGGKLWFHEDSIRQLTVIEREESKQRTIHRRLSALPPSRQRSRV